MARRDADPALVELLEGLAAQDYGGSHAPVRLSLLAGAWIITGTVISPDTWQEAERGRAQARAEADLSTMFRDRVHVDEPTAVAHLEDVEIRGAGGGLGTHVERLRVRLSIVDGFSVLDAPGDASASPRRSAKGGR